MVDLIFVDCWAVLFIVLFYDCRRLFGRLRVSFAFDVANVHRYDAVVEFVHGFDLPSIGGIPCPIKFVRGSE
jgi:hypothetical protein